MRRPGVDSHWFGGSVTFNRPVAHVCVCVCTCVRVILLHSSLLPLISVSIPPYLNGVRVFLFTQIVSVLITLCEQHAARHVR